MVEDWERVAQRRKTIIFVDTVAEVGDMTQRLCKRYGAGAAVCLHGGKNPDGKTRTAGQNSAALQNYETGAADILVACQMIGEGFDVPATDVVMSLNSSLSRLEMNQFVGRCVRAAPGKDHGLYIDYGTASHRHGLIEHQHEMQNVEALAAAGTRIAAARALGRMAPEQDGRWRAAPGEKRSIFVRSRGDRYEIYEFNHEAEKILRRRTGKSAGSMTQFQKKWTIRFMAKRRLEWWSWPESLPNMPGPRVVFWRVVVVSVRKPIAVPVVPCWKAGRCPWRPWTGMMRSLPGQRRGR